MERAEFRVAGLSEPIGHRTDAVRAGRLLSISGCVPTGERGNVVGAGRAERRSRAAALAGRVP